MDGLRRQAPLLFDEEDPCWMVARDKRVSANYQSMVSFLIEELSEPGSDNDVSRTGLRDKYIAAVQASMKRVFHDLNLESFGRPLQDGTFLFTKGTSHNFPYKNLSGGEKQKVDLIIQFSIRDMLSSQLNFTSNVLVLDEVFDGLDVLGCNRVIDMISSLTDIKNVFIVTHRKDLSIPTDREIVVVKSSVGITEMR
jgi:ABC-type transport system involved in cytochrome bd biosynthesis fused ATPase/permease subunit